MKKIMKLVVLLILVGCRGKMAKMPSPIPYRSIEYSKKNNAFINKYTAKAQYLILDGKKYFVNQAWVEHPHFERNQGDVILKNANCIVMNFNYDIVKLPHVHSYLKADGYLNATIWFYLNEEDYKKDGTIKDTLPLYYRETLTSPKKDKIYLFFKNE